jgi:UDP-glucose 4-epimerase
MIADYYSGKSILVTGAAGFIGSAVIKALGRVDCHLTCLTKAGQKLDAPAGGKAEITVHPADLRSPDLWDELLNGIDMMFHFAAQTSSQFANEHPVEDMEINLVPVVRFIAACQKKGVRPDIVFSGTVTQTGLTASYPVDEHRQDLPITMYDISKLAAEKYWQYYGLEMGGRSVTLRLANVYGPGARSGRDDRGILNKMVINALAGKPLFIYGKGNYIRDYIFIEDVVRAFLTAGANLQHLNGRYYVLGSGKGHSIKQMAETVKNLVAETIGRQVNLKHIDAPANLSPIECRHFVADIDAFHNDCGWKPMVSLHEGIRRTIQFFREGHR